MEPQVLAVLPLVGLVQPCMPREALALAVHPLKLLVLGSVALGPLVRQFRNLGLLVRPCMPREALALGSVALEPLVRRFRNLEPLVRRFRNLVPLVLPFVLLGLLVRRRAPLEPLVLRFINLKKLLRLRKSNRNSAPTGVNSQIAHPGRSGIILPAKSRSPRFDP